MVALIQDVPVVIRPKILMAAFMAVQNIINVPLDLSKLPVVLPLQCQWVPDQCHFAIGMTLSLIVILLNLIMVESLVERSISRCIANSGAMFIALILFNFPVIVALQRQHRLDTLIPY